MCIVEIWFMNGDYDVAVSVHKRCFMSIIFADAFYELIGQVLLAEFKTFL